MNDFKAYALAHDEKNAELQNIKVDDARVYDKLGEIDCFERFMKEIEGVIRG